MTVLVTPLVPTLLGRQAGNRITHRNADGYEITGDKTLHVTQRIAEIDTPSTVATYRPDEWCRAEVHDTDHRDELERIAQWIVDNVPGEPSTSDGVLGIITRLLTPQPTEAAAVGEVDPIAREIAETLKPRGDLDAVLASGPAAGTPDAYRLALRAATRVSDLHALIERLEDLSGIKGEHTRLTDLLETKSREAHQAQQTLDMARKVHEQEMTSARALLTQAERTRDEAREEATRLAGQLTTVVRERDIVRQDKVDAMADLDHARDEAARLRGELPSTYRAALKVGDRIAVEDDEGAGVAGVLRAWTTSPGGHPFVLLCEH